MKTKTRGYVEFDAMTEDAFKDLVKETIETSDFMTTEWDEGKLLIMEIEHNGEWGEFFDGEASEELL